MRKLLMLSIVPMLLMLLICGCDKKVSQRSVVNAQRVHQAALSVAKTQESIVGRVAAINPGKDNTIAEIVSNDRDTLNSMYFLSMRLRDGLAAKSKISEEAARQIVEAQVTLASLRESIIATKPKLKPKTDADSEVLVSWNQNIEPQLKELIDATAALNASITVDIQMDTGMDKATQQ